MQLCSSIVVVLPEEPEAIVDHYLREAAKRCKAPKPPEPCLVDAHGSLAEEDETRLQVPAELHVQHQGLVWT